MVTKESDVVEESYLFNIVSGLVDRPDKIKINKTSDDMGILLTLTVDKTDMGKVIGKKGNTAQSIRFLVHTFGYKNRKVINVKILEPEFN